MPESGFSFYCATGSVSSSTASVGSLLASSGEQLANGWPLRDALPLRRQESQQSQHLVEYYRGCSSVRRSVVREWKPVPVSLAFHESKSAGRLQPAYLVLNLENRTVVRPSIKGRSLETRGNPGLGIAFRTMPVDALFTTDPHRVSR